MSNIERNNASFRDNSGFVLSKNGQVYRQINKVFQDEFESYVTSGLHQALIKHGLVVDYKEVDVELDFVSSEVKYKVIKPTQIAHISYPYEWCFSQLKDAALLTLEVQLLALEFGFTLKDANSYNVQFHKGRPIFIDTLSFLRYKQGSWVAYRQFCQHFLAPLLLKSKCDYRLGRLAELYIDGIPLDLASKLLPLSSWFNINVLSHIHLHSKVQSYYAGKSQIGNSKLKKANDTISKSKLKSIIQSLKSTIIKTEWRNTSTEWGEYYENNNYSESAMNEKYNFIDEYLRSQETPIESVADIGANNGYFSRLASLYSDRVVSFDIDELAVEKNYKKIKADKETSITPIVLDLLNPTSAIGWANKERNSFIERSGFEVVFALAIIHHLAIGNNLPFNEIIKLFHCITLHTLVIEFVPKEDSQIKKMLKTREDIFDNYNEKEFENSFSDKFEIIKKQKISHSTRTLYFLERIDNLTDDSSKSVS
ncbi:hypothetical protein AB4383_01335 [Vibrio breoganii]